MTGKTLSKRVDEIDSTMNKAASDMADLTNEMQEYFDDRSEKWQEGEKGEEYQQKIEDLTEIESELQDLIGRLQALTD